MPVTVQAQRVPRRLPLSHQERLFTQHWWTEEHTKMQKNGKWNGTSASLFVISRDQTWP